ncbi:ATP-binding cassette domain-containing protein [Arthrobacter sp. MSA 4-2]|uniref:ABC transporter ATP-binding protein n=1 Tax=Arthrobacter sp. MSA 4-2 TaxID=2794349 RepID=UPI0018E7AB38|nr:ABC transporter ATP-binding protein [Arthrobacter sp. MSA 4-2]MBJ2122399.1 ATP-binding cassette domain-containing protein [Arthrobacter sp. MSA 4-2]
MIRLECSSYAYDGGPVVLSGVDLAVEPGALVHVVGPSGSGKTTLARLLAGQTGAGSGAQFRGALTLGGDRLGFSGSPEDPRIDPAAWSSTVAYAAQRTEGQLSMMSATVAEEIAFGPANRGMPAGELRAAVQATAARLGLTDLLNRDPRRLSGGQLRRTIIAAAVVGNPRVLILDEPFQGLDAGSRAEVARTLEVLRAAGTALLICAPMLPGSAPQHSRVLALVSGRPVFDGTLAQAWTAGLERYAIGTEGSAPDVRRDPPQGCAAPVAASDVRQDSTGGPLTELAGVSFSYRREGTSGQAEVLRGVDLRVDPGDIVGLTGANGSGKSTLLQHLNGLLRASSGTVTVAGRLLGRRTATGRLAGAVGFLFQDTDQQLFERTVLREVAYGPTAAGAGREGAQERARTALAAVGLGHAAGEHPYELGFVERRLVAFASLIASEPSVWVLDEPTAGLDLRGRNRVGELLLGHAAAGGAVILATHDGAFADALCTRILELKDGRILSGGARRGADGA